jgi:hypothetical protein
MQPLPVRITGPGSGGDPHFKTWSGSKYDYHGACDLVLLNAPSFAFSTGLDIHIRTKHRRSFSYITNVAVRIGTEIFEVTNNKDEEYYLNGVANVVLPAKFHEHDITRKKDNDKQQSYHITLDGRESLVVRVYRDFLAVAVMHGEEKDFGDSLGLMGSYYTGDKLSRDGQSIFTDIDAFGQEWQVQSSDPQLFQTMQVPQHPTQCTPPPPQSSQHRRLRETDVDMDAARKACAHVAEEDREFCIFDVLATSDVDMAGAY